MNLEACDPPAPRNVTLATVNFRPHTSSGPEENRQNYQAYIQEAGEKKADIVCLPEGVTVVGTNKSYIEVAEPVPGPTTAFLGKAAKQYSMYIVAGLYEKVGETVYNTAVLIDRQGNLAGTYRKTALPREEIEGGITPGTEFPVFQTDFGTVGMMICWDVFFPEPARRLAYAGAEVIFLPIWGGNETLIQARAIENQVYVVTSSFDAKNAIWGREGEPLAEANTNGSVALYTVDLNQPTHWPWLGDFQARILREGPGIREE
jgi:predicted amidohydrolase